MHNTEMNPADFGGIVVDQTNGTCVKGTLNGKFFAHLSLDRLLKRLQAEGKECVIFVIDVAADANGSFGNQTLFASLLATNIMKDALSISDHHVWDNLFKGWIGFRAGAGLKTVVLLVQNFGQIAINISAETLKNTQLLKKRAGKNENIFACNRHD